MSNPWFRMYTDFLRDPKLLSLAFEDQRHFIAVLALKCEGTLDNGAAGSLLDRMVAQFIWVDHSAIQEVKRRLIDADLIDSEWQPLGWAKRQFRSDSSTERTRKYRENKQKTIGDGYATSQERHSDALDTDTDTDTDTELPRKRTRKAPEDWTPNPIQQRQAHVDPGVDVERELTRFRNHTFDRPKDDWDGEWVKWLCNATPRRVAPGEKPNVRVSAEESKHPALVTERLAEREARAAPMKFGRDM